MRLPVPEDILRDLPEGHGLQRAQVEAALELAPDVLETMTGVPIRRRLAQQDLFLHGKPERLNLYPVEDVRTKGQPISHEPKTGIIYPELEPSNYLVTYVVGYGREDVPAIITRTVAHMTRYRLLGTEEDREEAKAAIEIIRQLRAKTKEERARDEAR